MDAGDAVVTDACPVGTVAGNAWGSRSAGRPCVMCGTAHACVVVRQPVTYDVWCSSGAAADGCAF